MANQTFPLVPSDSRTVESKRRSHRTFLPGQEEQFDVTKIMAIVASAKNFNQCIDLLDEHCGQHTLAAQLYEKASSFASLPEHWVTLYFRSLSSEAQSQKMLQKIDSLTLVPEQWLKFFELRNPI